jgi:UDP-N-acetylmuramate--alanine ligase
VLFQPHRYTRTRDLIDEFARSFSDADELAVIDIYPAGEPVLEGIHSEILCQKIREGGLREVLYIKDRQKVAQHFQARLKPGDIFLTLGAGDVWKEGVRLLETLMQKEGPVNVGDK